MKFSFVFILLSVLIAGVSAQIHALSFVTPPFDSQVKAGVPFNVTVQLEPISRFLVVALYFGAQIGDDPGNEELGQELLIVPTPTFVPTGPEGQLQLTVPLTVQNPGLTNITVATFFVVGVAKTPGTSVTKTRVSVVSSGY